MQLISPDVRAVKRVQNAREVSVVGCSYLGIVMMVMIMIMKMTRCTTRYRFKNNPATRCSLAKTRFAY